MQNPSPVDLVGDEFVDAYATLHPCLGTFIGIAGLDDRLTDFSPDGHAARAQLGRKTLTDLALALAASAGPGGEPTAHDRVAAAQMTERVEAELELYDRGVTESDLNVLASPMQELREVFSLMPTDSAADWDLIAHRMRGVPEALDGLTESLRRSAESGRVSARRQVLICAERAAKWTFFTEFAAAGPDSGTLRSVAEQADAAYVEFGRFLSDHLVPVAPAADAVGRERYQAAFRFHNGADMDLDETYRWGLDEVARISAEQSRVAGQIVPGGALAEAVAELDADPARRVEGTDALQAWLQETSDRVVDELSGVHFDIPEPVRLIQCRIAPAGANSGAYYTPPNEDFSRPGRMWWSVPPGQTSFPTWPETTTVFHEGVPGHHLQMGQTAYRSEILNRFQRLLCWVPGHGEGWALYAEQLMDELGYFGDPGEKLGMLDSQLLRAVRVVIDIGMHLQLRIPPGTGWHDGEVWTADLGWEYLRAHTLVPDQTVTDECNRYLGWPGQAPAYKVGERVWLQARADAKARHGSSFDLLGWHRAALDLGSMGLDPLRAELDRI